MPSQKEKNDCLFCKIAGKEIPSDIVYEDKDIISFLDIKPVNPGHTLVVLKKHVATILALEDKDVLVLFKAVRDISKAAMKAVNAQGFNVHINNFRAAGQLVDHVHIHIIPRFEQDSLELWHGKEMLKEETQKIAGKIRSLLN